MNSVRSQFLSINYRLIRRLVIMQQSLFKKDLEGAIIVGDKINHLLMNSPLKHLFKFSIPNNIMCASLTVVILLRYFSVKYQKISPEKICMPCMLSHQGK